MVRHDGSLKNKAPSRSPAGMAIRIAIHTPLGIARGASKNARMENSFFAALSLETQ